ncbi:hypothetical protein JW935_03565 [candidate division KSB1 bacterium]|nr:hypothetical protein [candidate division KSB1 bacterium]
MVSKNIILFLILISFVIPVSADSIFSSIGLGIPRYLVTPKAIGMGGAGIAVMDPMGINAVNPAAIGINGVTTLTIDFDLENVETQTRTEKTTTRQGRPTGFRFGVPFKKNLNFLLSLKSQVSSKYTLSTNNFESDVSYSKLVRGEGGLSSAGIGLFYAPTEWLSFGINADMNFGSYTEEWKLEFYDGTYQNTSDEITSHLVGHSFDFGAYVMPYGKLSVGLVYKTGGRLTANGETKLANGIEIETSEVEIEYPQALGIGLAFPVTKLLFAMDFYNQFWSTYRLGGIDYSFKDFIRIGGGVEYTDENSHLAKYYRRVSYRLGGYYAQLPFTNEQGTAVTEKFISFGIGLPFHFNAGRIDLSLEVGHRGSLTDFNHKEGIYRLSASITSGELWFRRR